MPTKLEDVISYSFLGLTDHPLLTQVSMLW